MYEIFLFKTVAGQDPAAARHDPANTPHQDKGQIGQVPWLGTMDIEEPDGAMRTDGATATTVRRLQY